MVPGRLLISVITLLLFISQCPAQKLDSLFSGGKTAYDSGYFEQSLAYFETFQKIRDNYPPTVMYLAMLYSQTGQDDKAFEKLNKLLIMNADTAFLSRSDFDPVRDKQRFKEIRLRYETMLSPVHHSELAFSLEEAEVHPETLAYDAERSRFFIGSIRLRSIYIYESGRSYVFKSGGEDSLLAVTGMDIDREEGLLWVASANFPQMKEQENAADGSFIHVYDIISGSLLRRFHLAGDVLIGDLIVGRRGDVYMTNSRSPEIYRATIDSVYQWKSFPELRSLQGITEGAGNDIYFSDYIHGIFHIKGESMARVSHPDSVSVKGIDGLYFRNGKLIGMQNGVFPQRVTQFELVKEEVIGKAVFLDKNLEELNEPVQGVWVGDWFYFIANSPWAYYNDSYDLDASAPKPEIWRTNLVR